jgi:uncharacterized protein
MPSSAPPAPRSTTRASEAEGRGLSVPQFLVTAHDGLDAEAPARRAAARPAHLAGIRDLGHAVIVGGAMLDEAGAPVGSTMVVEFSDRAAVEAWIAADPYTLGGVWQSVAIVPFRVAVERNAEPR